MNAALIAFRCRCDFLGGGAEAELSFIGPDELGCDVRSSYHLLRRFLMIEPDQWDYPLRLRIERV